MDKAKRIKELEDALLLAERRLYCLIHVMIVFGTNDASDRVQGWAEEAGAVLANRR